MYMNKKRILFLLELLGVFILTIFVNIVAGIKNDGLEGDEVFSYISSTSMGGFKGICYLDDQTWYDADYFENAVTATGTERFNIKMVVENQAMDTHPPFYYLLLNLVCSVFKGQYSRWFGIGLNIFFLLFVELGLYFLLQYFINNRQIALISSAIFCCSFLSVNMTLFIRMYVLVMALTLFQSWYHLKLYDKVMSVNGYSIKKYWKNYVLLAALTIAGSLTHYYFLICQCLIAAEFILALWLHKKYKDIYRYISVMAVSAVLYIAMYPAAINHLFLKYRGRDAVHKFLKESSLFKEAVSMMSSFNRQLFKGFLPLIILVLLILTVLFMVQKKMNLTQLIKPGILVLPSLIYFYGISKASPFITIRYVSPAAALLYAAVIIWAKLLIDGTGSDKMKKSAGIALCVCMFFTSFYFYQSPVKAAYFAERRDILNKLSEDTDFCVFAGDDMSYWRMWEDYINYPLFQGLFYIDGQAKNPIADAQLLNQ